MLKRGDFVKSLAGGIAWGMQAAGERSGITITDARLYHLEVSVEQVVKTSFGSMSARHLVLLELVDEGGHTGYGESWINFPAWAPQERMAAFRTAFLPYLKGRRVADVRSFVPIMAKAFGGPARQSGTMGPLLSSLCAVEMALVEMAAKRSQLPVCKLLFKDPARHVRVYGSGLNAPLPWKRIDSYLECGVSLFKLKLGFDDQDDRKSLAELKKHLGNRAKVAVDVNRSWTFPQALEWVKRLADLDVQWLEEPLRVEEDSRTGELASRSAVPLAGGENILVEPGSDMAAVAGAPFAILQPDMTKYCLTHDFLRLLPEAAKRGKRVVPHFLGSAPGQAFSLHLGAGCGKDPLVEWDANANPLHTLLFAEPIRIVDGAVEIPARPGLGWTPKLNARDRVG